MNRPLAAITGASSGIGEASSPEGLRWTTIFCSSPGARTGWKSWATNFPGRHGSVTVEALGADLTDQEDLALVESRIATDPRLALLVNNAGFGTKGLSGKRRWRIRKKCTHLHVMATVRLCHAALRNLVPRDHGGIINVASVAAFVRRAGGTSYGSTKSWMTVFTEGLYLELRSARSRVAVQALCPGFTFTEFHDTMKVSRESMAAGSFWMTAEQVVDASLTGLRKRRLFVIPGWRYRAIVALVSKLPVPLRLAIESRISREQSAK